VDRYDPLFSLDNEPYLMQLQFTLKIQHITFFKHGGTKLDFHLKLFMYIK